MSKESVTFLTEEEQQELKSKFLGFRQGLVGVGPSRHLLPPHCMGFTKKYKDFKFCESDVVIATFPRSGTTWTQEIVWTMRNGLDFNEASKVSLNVRSPSLNILETCKVVYVARNPRDVCVSFYHHQSSLGSAEFIGDFSDFVDFWCRDLYLQAPFWGHLKEAWAKRQHRNLLFPFYEDMKENHMRELKRLDAFLGTGLSEEQLRQVAEHTSISQMKSRSSVNPPLSVYTERARKEGRKDFIRKGAIGDWVNYFTPELETKFQAWLKTGEEIAKEIPFKYKAELADTSGK